MSCTNHCWHTDVLGAKPGEKVCCVCRIKKIVMPLMWEGD